MEGCELMCDNHNNANQDYGSIAICSVEDQDQSLLYIGNNNHQHQELNERNVFSDCIENFNRITQIIQSCLFKECLSYESFRSIRYAQCLSLLLALSAAANSTLSTNCNVSCPTAQSIFVYIFLSLHLLPSLQSKPSVTSTEVSESHTSIVPHGKFCHKSSSSSTTSTFWYHYIIPALLDVEANYLCVLALRYASLASVTILDAFAIPSCMIFGKLLGLRKEPYFLRHYIGIIICLLGLVITVLCDVDMSRQSNEDNDFSPYVSNPILGDLLALAGGLIYGLNDTIAEKFVKDFDRLQVRWMMDDGNLMSVSFNFEGAH